MKKVFMEIVENNKSLFTKEELNKLKSNITLSKKIFLLGLMNGRQIYGKD